jgi:hypothetical protein
MTMSFTHTESQTFTITHARHLASKMATDLKRIQRFYNNPGDRLIDDYEGELTALLKAGYLREVTYGFQRNGDWIEPTLKYNALELNGWDGVDDDPGKIRPRADIAGAVFTSFLTYSSAWSKLTADEKASFEGGLPIKRGYGDVPGVSGYLEQDRSYSAGGRALNRSSVRSWA